MGFLVGLVPLRVRLVHLVPLLCLLGGCFSAEEAVPGDGEITLEVVTAASDVVLTEALDSTPIQLRVAFSDEKRAGGISLFDCKAVSHVEAVSEGINAAASEVKAAPEVKVESEVKPVPEVKVESKLKADFEMGPRVLQLTDSNGCRARLSPMGCMVAVHGVVLSPVFQLSSLADVGHVNITCSWETCFSSLHPKCVDRCDYFTHRHRGSEDTMRPRWRERRDRDNESPRRYLSTTIRVLPSQIGRAHHHGPSFGRHAHHGSGPSSGHHGHHGVGLGSGPRGQEYGGGHQMWTMPDSNILLYLNPITCSVFLLILSVFLGFYVSFVRSLRRSVEDIKHEIQGQRSRDKFLVR